ncbi:MAG: hypothetical protein ACLSGB_16140 [Dorea sp.]
MLEKKVPGALTASGTMEACRRLEIPTAVTCGIEESEMFREKKFALDLPALAEIPVNLVRNISKGYDKYSTDIYMASRRGVFSDIILITATGYVFYSAHEKLDGTFDTQYQWSGQAKHYF